MKSEKHIKKTQKILLGVLIIQFLFLPLASAQSIETSVSSTKIENDKTITGNFNKITAIETNNHQTKSEKISVLIPTPVDVPIQGRVTYQNNLYNGTVEVCIENTCNSNVQVTGGIFYANIQNVPIEDPHSEHILRINIQNTTVVNETFYPAGAPQGDLTVNGDLIVTGPGITLTDSPIIGAIRYFSNDFFGYTNLGWQSFTNGTIGTSLWTDQGTYINPLINNMLAITANSLGVGVLNPLAPLHVNGAAIFRGPTDNSSDPGELVYDTSGDYYKYYNGTEWIPIPNGTISYNGTLWQQNGTNIYYDSGNVAVGKNNANTALDVVGTIRASVDVCIENGACLSVGPGAATLAGLTSTTTNGQFTSGGLVGYEAANDLCNTEYPGSHFCRTDEIIKIIATQDISTWSTLLSSWIAEGPPGFTADANDCMGWTSNDNEDLGAFWDYNANGGGMGWLTNCYDLSLPLGCCQ